MRWMMVLLAAGFVVPAGTAGANHAVEVVVGAQGSSYHFFPVIVGGTWGFYLVVGVHQASQSPYVALGLSPSPPSFAPALAGDLAAFALNRAPVGSGTSTHGVVAGASLPVAGTFVGCTIIESGGVLLPPACAVNPPP